MASTGWDPIVIRAECFDLREVRHFFLLLMSSVFLDGSFEKCASDFGAARAFLRRAARSCMSPAACQCSSFTFDVPHMCLLCAGRVLRGMGAGPGGEGARLQLLKMRLVAPQDALLKSENSTTTAGVRAMRVGAVKREKR